MLLLAIVAFVFGLLASLAFTAAPFIAINVITVFAILGLGFFNGWSLKLLIADLVIAIVLLQAGYFAGIISKFRDLRRSTPVAKPDGRPESASTMDRTR